MSQCDQIKMSVIDNKRTEILATRWGLDAADPQKQAECAVMGHVFATFNIDRSDPFYSKCIYCGWKE